MSFWTSDKGLSMRIDMLSDGIEWGIFNNAVKTIAKSMGVKQFIIAGGDDFPNICEYCEKYVDRIYKYGWFMPILPAHPHCHHFIDILIEES